MKNDCFCRIREADINDPLTLKALDEFTVWICGFGLDDEAKREHWELSKAIKEAIAKGEDNARHSNTTTTNGRTERQESTAESGSGL